jgi:hypothetical protein
MRSSPLLLGLVVAHVGLAGCEAPVDAPAPSSAATATATATPATDYALVLDLSLTPEQAQDVASAADEWQAAAMGLSFDIRSEACDGPALHSICVRAVSEAALHEVGPNVAGETYYTASLDGAVIGLSGTGQLTWIAAHELGHAMGLEHVTTWGELMNPAMVTAGNSPTCGDADQFWALRGTQVACDVAWSSVHVGF